MSGAAAPDLPYRPQTPDDYDPGIGLIGCGAITEHHLGAYRDAGFDVVALCDIVPEQAEARREEFFPDAATYTDYEAVLERDDIEVVDLALHPTIRQPIVEAAIEAGKHVLSQKPFVVDLDVGERLVELADERGVRLAVNQNGRWAPHFSYARHAVEAEVLGEVFGLHFDVHWDHGWIEKTRFEEIHHAILYDFGIHWFDMATCLIDETPKRVFASATPAPEQTVAPPLLGEAVVQYETAQASFAFDGATAHGPADRTRLTGTDASLTMHAPELATADVDIDCFLHRDRESTAITLEGAWYNDGFRGSMGELLCAIEEDREPTHSARDNLDSLELCFAAVASAEREAPQVPGDVRALLGSAA